MLPPQLRSATAVSKYRVSSSNALRASSTAIVRSSTSHTQSRSFWGGRRRGCWDWTSHLDPAYQRYTRYRTLKTRAKLLKNLQRRGAFEWDANTKPFFTPSNLRCASHWRGRQWYTNDDPTEKLREEAAAEEKRKEEDGYELSKREKEWKDKMEATRKRIQQDPYEAVFGKRFEPFWSPLIPSWMREEMGLRNWPKEQSREGIKTSASNKTDRDGLKAALTTLRKNLEDETKTSSPSPQTRIAGMMELKTKMEDAVNSPRSATDPSKPFSRMTTLQRVQHINQIIEKQQASQPAKAEPVKEPSSYAYASSTSWDSLSNKTKKVEWDSKSNETKTFEYDPISNRMIEIKSPSKVAIDSDSSAVRQSVAGPKSDTSKTISTSPKAVDLPVKQSNDVRKAIPIPPPLSQPSHSITLGYEQTSVGPVRSTAVSSTPVKPAALAKLPVQDLDLLTADNVRASMGKVKEIPTGSKATTPEEKAKLERHFDSNLSAQDAEIDTFLKERSASKQEKAQTSAWDEAEMEDILRREADALRATRDKLIKNEDGLFHIERQKRQLAGLHEKLQAATERLGEDQTVGVATAKRSILQTSLQGAGAEKDSSPQGLQTSMRRTVNKYESTPLQSSIERMQSKELPTAAEQDLDDAAAHESTEPIDVRSAVPKEWTKAADLLQSDRVKRTADKRPFPKARWVDDMNARKVAYEQQKAEQQIAEDAKNAESNAQREKTRKMLEDEIAETKLKMQAFEGRYGDKVKSLRGELDIAFKQSSVHSEKHLERIRELEEQISVSKEKESKYVDKVKSLRDELERAYKQSAVHVEKHLERIRYLEGEVETTQSKPPPAEKSPPDFMPGEGDICVRAPSFGDNGKWYKRPANPPQPTAAEIEKAERKIYDQALVSEVRDIYEKRYGVIDENHEQPQVRSQDKGLQDLQKELNRSLGSPEPVAGELEDLRLADLEKKLTRLPASDPKTQESSKALAKKPTLKEKKAERRARRAEKAEEQARQVVEVESDVDLGEELARYENDNSEAYKFEEGLTASESAEKMKGVIADSLEQEIKVPDNAKAIPSAGSIEWTDPPLYKVLAYDSGNDMMSSATTTTSVLPGSAEERPLGIPEALSQLYQPARFVPYFAELQSENFQAIAATREVIVFRQVRGREATQPAKSEDPSESAIQEADEKGRFVAEQSAATEKKNRKPRWNKNASKGRKDVSRVNPIDGTSRGDSGPTTGNFASPTGFVNHDPVFPTEAKEDELLNDQSETRSDTYSTIAKEPTAKTSRQIWESLPGSNETPVKRTESVFSGMTRSERRRHSKELQQAAEERNRLKNLAKKAEKQRARAEENQWRNTVAEEQEEYEHEEAGEQERAGAKTGSSKTLRYVLGAGVGTAGVMYLVGALAERERTQSMTPISLAAMEQARQRQSLEQEVRWLEHEAARLAREWNSRR